MTSGAAREAPLVDDASARVARGRPLTDDQHAERDFERARDPSIVQRPGPLVMQTSGMSEVASLQVSVGEVDSGKRHRIDEIRQATSSNHGDLRRPSRTEERVGEVPG